MPLSAKQVVKGAAFSPDYSPVGGQRYGGAVTAASLLAEATVHYNETSPTGTDGRTLTGLTNLGAGGSDYDATITNTGQDVIMRDWFGKTSMYKTYNGDRIQASGATRLTVPGTFISVHWVERGVTNPETVLDSNDTINYRWIVQKDNGGGEYDVGAGSIRSTSQVPGSFRPHMIVVQFNGGTTSTIQIDLETRETISLDIGMEDLDFGYWGGGSNGLQGYLFEMALWDRALTDEEITLIQTHLADRWTLPTKLKDAVVWLKETGLNSSAVDGGSGSYITSWTNEGTGGSGYDIDTLQSDNVIVNGDFDTDTDWTKGTGWSIGSGVASSDGSQSGDSDLTATVAPLVDGVMYKVVFTTSGRTAGNLTPVCGTQEGTDFAGNAEETQYILANGTGFSLRADLDWDGSVDDVTCQPVVKLSTLQGIACPYFPGKVGMRTAAQQSLSQPATQFVVAKGGDNGLSASYLTDAKSGTTRCQMYVQSTNLRINAGSNLTDTSVGYPFDAPFVARGVFNGTSSVVQFNKNTAVTGDAGTEAFKWASVGTNKNGTSDYVGEIVEIIVFNEVLTDVETEAVHNYLVKKWAIPLEIEQALLWYNENGHADSGTVTAWNNRGTGGSAWHADVKTGTGDITATTINGISALDFPDGPRIESNGGSDKAQANEFFAVFSLDTLAQENHIFDGEHSSYRQNLRIEATTGDVEIFAGDSVGDIASPVSASTTTLINARFNGASSTGGKNLEDESAASADPGDHAINDIMIGARYDSNSSTTLDGQIGEIIMFDSERTDEVRVSIKDYAIRKYDITL
tara:strand:+ start:324 stop:2726 length:2403 start_codon:yes stop_codon:yes gene_type:complete